MDARTTSSGHSADPVCVEFVVDVIAPAEVRGEPTMRERRSAAVALLWSGVGAWREANQVHREGQLMGAET